MLYRSIGLGFYFNNKPNIDNDFIAKVKSENIIEQNVTEEKNDTPIVEKEKTSINLVQKITKNENPQNIENEYNSEYVTVNGKPVYDKQKADSIAIQALMLLAQNLERSKEAVEIFKQNINSINNLINN